jgi:Spy/CpxP family protein refolding chaperone
MREANTLRWLVIGLICALTAAAEEPANNLKSVHQKLEADKKAIVAQYMELTEAEAQRFWPVYDQMQSDQRQLAQRMRDLLSSYAADYRGQTLTDEKAQKLLDDWIAIDQDEAKQRATAARDVTKVLPGKKAARYLQIESEYRALVRYDLAAIVPLAR